MKRVQQLSLFFLLSLTMALLTGCSAAPTLLDMVNDSTEAPAQAVLPSPTCTPYSAIPYMGADGKVYLDTTSVFDPAVEAPECYGIGQISQAPGGQQFLVVMDCPDGQNEAFLFNASGMNKTRITGQYDYVDYFDYKWSKDGKYLLYARINSCCTSGTVDGAPAAGEVRYDLLTGEKVLLH